jgi:uncharacterized protein (DUF983 family)
MPEMGRPCSSCSWPAQSWLPLILDTTLGPLRPMKGLMIALQYHHKAAEGQAGPP